MLITRKLIINNSGINNSGIKLFILLSFLFLVNSSFSQLLTEPVHACRILAESKDQLSAGFLRTAEELLEINIEKLRETSVEDYSIISQSYFDLINENFLIGDARLAEFIKYRGNSPFLPHAAMMRGYFGLQQNNYPNAEIQFREAQRLAELEFTNRNDTIYATFAHTALYWRGISLSQQGKYQDANPVFEECARKYPRGNFADDALYALGQSSEINRKYEEAISYFSKIATDYSRSNSYIAARIREANNRIIMRDATSAQMILDKTDEIWNHIIQKDSIGKMYEVQTYANQAGENILYLKGEAYNQLNNFNLAIIQFKSFLETYFDSPLKDYVRLGAAWALLNKKEPDKALKYLNDIIQEPAKDKVQSLLAAAKLYRTIALKRTGEREQAVKELLDLSLDPAYPNHGQVLLELGQIYYEQNDFEQARKTLERAEREAVDANIAIRIQILLGSSNLELKRWDKAAQEYKNAEQLALNSRDIFLPNKKLYLSEIWLKQGLALVQNHKSNEAVSLFLKFISESKDDKRIDEALFWLAESYYRSDLLSNAAGAYNSLIEKYSESPRREEALYGLGWSYFRLKEFNKSSETFDKMLKEFPKTEFALEVLSRQGDGYYVVKNYKLAADAYKRAKNLAPNTEEGQYSAYQLCHALYRMGQNDQAVSALLDFVKRYSGSTFAPHALYLTGWIRFQQHKYMESIDDFRFLISAYPQSNLISRAHYSVADAFYNMGNYEMAMKSYRNVIQMFPSDPLAPEAMKGLQYCLMALGRNDEAIAIADTFISSNPGSPFTQDFILKKADMFYSGRKFKDAVAEYENFLKKYPDNDKGAEAIFWMEKSYISLNDIEKAESSFKTLATKYPRSDYVATGQLELGLMYKQLNNIALAEKNFQEIIDNFSSNSVAAQAGYELASIKYAIGDTVRAMNIFRNTADSYQGNEFADQSRYRIAMYYKGKGLADSARREFNIISKHLENPSLAAESQYRIGELWFREENYVPAIAAFVAVKEQFTGNEPWFSLSLLSLGECYEKVQNFDAARDIYQGLENLGTDDEYAKTAKRRLSRLPKK